jgi:hypothetical protein
MNKIILFTLLILSVTSFAQKEANMWYFGDYAALDFNSGSPVALTNSAMSQWEGCASIADHNGNLLFYTDGISIWNAAHTVMPNGTGLMGNNSSTQSGVIVKKPGSATLYYVFTVNDLYYSIVDMTANGGLGDVTVKNVFVYGSTAEKLTAVTHSNGTDIWIITHDGNTNEYYCHLLTTAGLNSTPVISAVGAVLNTSGTGIIGDLKASPDKHKLATALRGIGHYELLDFDPATGIISNPIILDPVYPADRVYGISFSPNSKILYGTENATGYFISQWDITSNNAAVINASRFDITSNNAWGIQLGPDKKIYVARFQHGYLSRIDFPDVLGAGCNFVDTGVWLAGKVCNLTCRISRAVCLRIPLR